MSVMAKTKIELVQNVIELLDVDDGLDALCWMKVRNRLQLRLQQLTNSQLEQLNQMLNPVAEKSDD